MRPFDVPTASLVVAILGLTATLLAALWRWAKNEGVRGEQMEQVLEGNKAIQTTLASVVEDIEQIRAQGANTDKAVAVHGQRLDDHARRLEEHGRQLAAMQAARHHG